MPIIYGEYNKEMLIPAKTFLHSAGLKKVYGSVSEAMKYTRISLQDHFSDLKNLDYILSITWANETSKEKIIDVFGFEDITPWPGNPDVSSWILKNGILQKENPATCGDSIILLGKEESTRRGCKNLGEFLKKIPRF